MEVDSAPRTVELLGGALFVALGLLLLAGSAVLAANTHDFLRIAERAPGRVEKLNAGRFHLEVAFTTVAGQRVSYSQNGFIAGHVPGQAVTVLYQRDRPRQSARLDEFGAKWGESLFVAAMGLGFAVLGAGELRSYRRARRRLR